MKKYKYKVVKSGEDEKIFIICKKRSGILGIFGWKEITAYMSLESCKEHIKYDFVRSNAIFPKDKVVFEITLGDNENG
jgi:hypothetical protein